MGSRNESDRTEMYKCCNSEVICGVKCKNCESYYHLSCTKLSSNAQFLEENSYMTCCEMINLDTDTVFYDTVEEPASSDSELVEKVDAQELLYIIKEQNVRINEVQDRMNYLHDKIKLLSNQISLLARIKNNGIVPQNQVRT